MLEQIKKYAIWAVVCGIIYFFMSYHIIFLTSFTHPVLLKKGELNLKYTFYNGKDKTAEKMISIDELRWDGIGDILVEEGWLTTEEMLKLEYQYDSQQ